MDGQNYGMLTWQSRQWPNNTQDVLYTLTPLNAMNNYWSSASFADKTLEIVAGVVSPKTDATQNITGVDRADYCRMRIKLKQGSPQWTFELQEVTDGNLSGWAARGANDKWNMENDAAGDKQNCNFDTKAGFRPGFDNTTNTLNPTFTWAKNLNNTKDQDQDVPLAFNKTYNYYWRFTMGDVVKRGNFSGLYLDDPVYPTLVAQSGASTLIAGVLSSAVLVYSTLA
jgi:hypothetical protein